MRSTAPPRSTTSSAASWRPCPTRPPALPVTTARFPVRSTSCCCSVRRRPEASIRLPSSPRRSVATASCGSRAAGGSRSSGRRLIRCSGDAWPSRHARPTPLSRPPSDAGSAARPNWPPGSFIPTSSRSTRWARRTVSSSSPKSSARAAHSPSGSHEIRGRCPPAWPPGSRRL